MSVKGAAAADGGVESPGAPPEKQPAETGKECSQEGSRSCAGSASRTPLRCESGIWQARPACEADERCDSEPGPEQGRCRTIANECMNRSPGVPFCDEQQTRRVCTDLVVARELPCGPLERCVGTGDRVRCGCVPGATDGPSGCEPATRCDQDNGGCDPLTQCLAGAGMRSCSECPPGYAGAGSTGCKPLAAALRISAGKLVPAFDPSVNAYTVALPFFANGVDLTVEAPPKALIERNGAPASSGQPQHIVLSRGETVVEIVLRTASDTINTYKVTFQRAPLGDAGMLKAAMPGTLEVFGYSVALRGDTLAVSAVYEDTGATHGGAVHVFRRDGSRFVPMQVLHADTPLDQECFGSSVSLSDDTLVVGAPYDSPCTPTSATRGGSVYVYRRDGEGWVASGRLTPPSSAPRDGFGVAVAVEGDTLAVGAAFADGSGQDSGAVHVFKRTADGWAYAQPLTAPQPTAGAQLGSMLALSGSSLAASSCKESEAGLASAGAVHVFSRDSAGAWRHEARLVAPAPEDHAVFGYGLALSEGRLAVGAPHYELFGQDSPRGQVIVFERRANQWQDVVTLEAPTARAKDAFGVSVSLSRALLAVGASGDSGAGRGVEPDPSSSAIANSGALYVYDLDSLGAKRPSAYVKAANASRGDFFGGVVAVGELDIAVSANQEASSAPGKPDDDSAPGSGAVYVYH